MPSVPWEIVSSSLNGKQSIDSLVHFIANDVQFAATLEVGHERICTPSYDLIEGLH